MCCVDVQPSSCTPYCPSIETVPPKMRSNGSATAVASTKALTIQYSNYDGVTQRKHYSSSFGSSVDTMITYSSYGRHFHSLSDYSAWTFNVIISGAISILQRPRPQPDTLMAPQCCISKLNSNWVGPDAVAVRFAVNKRLAGATPP